MVSKFYIDLIRELQALMVINFYKEDFLDWLLDLEILFDFENISYERKVGLALYKLVSMPYVGGNEYNLIKPDKVNTKFVHGQG